MFEFEEGHTKTREGDLNKTENNKLLVKHIQIRKESA